MKLPRLTCADETICITIKIVSFIFLLVPFVFELAERPFLLFLLNFNIHLKYLVFWQEILHTSSDNHGGSPMSVTRWVAKVVEPRVESNLFAVKPWRQKWSNCGAVMQ